MLWLEFCVGVVVVVVVVVAEINRKFHTSSKCQYIRKSSIFSLCLHNHTTIFLWIVRGRLEFLYD